MMNIKIILLSILFHLKIYSQQSQINVMITIDDIPTASYNLSKSKLIIDNDTINVDYEMGRFMILDKDLQRLKGIKNKEVILNFKYFTSCPEQKEYSYALKLTINQLLQRYLLIKVYNYASYPNTFIKNIGYGFEYNSPLGLSTLPKRKKMKRNPCLN